VAEQPLDEADVDAGLDEERRGGVAQHVRRDPAGKAARRGLPAKLGADRLRPQRQAVAVDEQAQVGRAGLAASAAGHRGELAAQPRVGDVGDAVAGPLPRMRSTPPSGDASSRRRRHSSPTLRPVASISRTAVASVASAASAPRPESRIATSPRESARGSRCGRSRGRQAAKGSGPRPASAA
jgi:hypothetical protein